MIPTTYFRRFAVLFAALTPTVVFAHPGHDGDHGGGLTWDFVSEALHRLTSPYHLAPAVVAAVLTLIALRLVTIRRNRAARRRNEQRC